MKIITIWTELQKEQYLLVMQWFRGSADIPRY